MYAFSLSLRQCKKTDWGGGGRPSLLKWFPREAQSVAGVRVAGMETGKGRQSGWGPGG